MDGLPDGRRHNIWPTLRWWQGKQNANLFMRPSVAVRAPIFKGMKCQNRVRVRVPKWHGFFFFSEFEKMYGGCYGATTKSLGIDAHKSFQYAYDVFRINGGGRKDSESFFDILRCSIEASRSKWPLCRQRRFFFPFPYKTGKFLFTCLWLMQPDKPESFIHHII